MRLAKSFFSWCFDCGYRRLIGKVAADNRYALKFNETIGMERIGVNLKAVMMHGVLQDEVWFGMSVEVDSDHLVHEHYLSQ